MQQANALAPGIYYLEVTGVELPNDQRPPRQLIVRTDLNVTLKASADEALAWVTDLKTGMPVAGVTVRFTETARTMSRARRTRTASRRVKLASPRKPWEAIVAIATTETGEFGVASVQLAGRHRPVGVRRARAACRTSPTSVTSTPTGPSTAPARRCTGRPSSAATTTLHYSLPAPGQPVTVTINDDQGNTLVQQQLTLKPLGAVDGSLELGPDASLGYYYLNVCRSATRRKPASASASRWRSIASPSTR